MPGRNTNWSWEETVLAFELYCRTPYGRINSSNAEIKELAQLIGRTTASVVMKMVNIGSLDPAQTERNVVGLRNASMMDRRVFNEFNANMGELAYNAFRIKEKYGQTDIIIDTTDLNLIPPGEYREQLVKTRRGQAFFRKSVLAAYHNRCCITGISVMNLLVASHIKPWRVSDELNERTNPSNGLCLNALHDKAFDSGLMTIDFDYRIILSSKLKTAEMDEDTKEWLKKYEGEIIELPDRFKPDRSFIEYHNEMIFES